MLPLSRCAGAIRRCQKGEIVMIDPVTFVFVAVLFKVSTFALVLVALGLRPLGVALFGWKLERPYAAE